MRCTMAKLVSFVACASIDNVPTVNGGPITHLVSPQTVIRPQFIPGTFSFGIAAGIADFDMQSKHNFRFTITNPCGQIINDSGEGVIPESSIQDTMPMKFQGFMISIDIRNLVVEYEGEYTFTFYIDEQPIGEHKIPIFKRAT